MITLALALNPVFHGRTKHIEVDYHFVHECVIHGDLCLQLISMDDQVADIFTKALPRPRFQHLCSKLLVYSTDHMFEGNDRVYIPLYTSVTSISYDYLVLYVICC